MGKDRKNKDRIILITTKITSDSYTEAFKGADWANTMEYDIISVKKQGDRPDEKNFIRQHVL